MKFNYKGRTKEGKLETGTIQAHSRQAAAALLQKYDIFVTAISQEKEKKSFLITLQSLSAAPKKNLAVFFKQLSLMLGSRVPVVASISSLAVQERNAYFRKVLQDVARSIEEGLPLSAALALHPKTFGDLYVNIVKSGEASGNIAGALGYVADHLEREHDILVQVRQALLYPFFVVCVLLVVLVIIGVEVMPRISELILQTNTPLPLFTKMVLGAYQFLANYWLALAVLVALPIISLIYYLRTKEGKQHYDKVSLDMPLAGSVLKKVFVARFCNTVATLLAAGVSINRALLITAQTVNNTSYQTIIKEVEQEVSRGEKISAVLSRYQEYFPPFVTQMIRVGEETGKLDAILTEIVRFYQKEIKVTIDVASTLLEPIMVIILGIVVAVLAISVLAPLYGTLGNI